MVMTGTTPKATIVLSVPLKSNMPPYLIFDFDGVIGDTWECVIASHLKYGSQASRAEAITGMNLYFNSKPNHTRGHTKTPEQMAATTKWTSEFGSIMHELGFELFTEFVQIIERIPTSYKAIVSSGSQKYVVPALANTAIRPTHILAFEDHHSKEDKIEAICRDWAVDVAEVYYITDSLADVYELENFVTPGKLLGVAWGFSGKENLLRKLPSEYIVDTPTDFTRHFTTMI